MAQLKISDVAQRSGFSAATLRYYEQVGVLPAPARTRSGYRAYDEHVLERLAFVARAKRLGCSLPEITELAAAWEGGECGPVQRRLSEIVAAKLDETADRVAELDAFTTELRRAQAVLRTHRPQGACDDRCGCVADESEPDVVGCSLGDADAIRQRAGEWSELVRHAVRRQPVDDGLRVELDRDTPLDRLIALTAAEHDCCGFFRFAITIDDGGIALEVRAPAEALSAVHALFGAAA